MVLCKLSMPARRIRKMRTGKEQIQSVFKHAEGLHSRLVKVVYLQDYDMEWGKLMTSGVDLWLNTPEKPLEASGTSGMKAALNGVPSLSVLDGWWIEGCLEGTTGWSIGGHCGPVSHPDEAESLYCKLGQITAMFYEHPEEYHTIMRAAIAINGSFFNSQRMLSQYLANAYCPIHECAGRTLVSSRSRKIVSGVDPADCWAVFLCPVPPTLQAGLTLLPSRDRQLTTG